LENLNSETRNPKEIPSPNSETGTWASRTNDVLNSSSCRLRLRGSGGIGSCYFSLREKTPVHSRSRKRPDRKWVILVVRDA
jgi:hypothetical protein